MKKTDNKPEESKDKGRYRALTFIKGPSLAKEKDVEISESEIPTWPYLIRKEFLAAIICTIILIVWSILLDAPLEELSDPTMTPNPAKAPWYFLGLQELLHYFPPVVGGVILPALAVIALIVIPYFRINFKREGMWKEHPKQTFVVVAVFVGAVSLVLLLFKVDAMLIPTLIITAFMFCPISQRKKLGSLVGLLAVHFRGGS